MKEDLSYDKLEPEYIKIYQDTFSEEEIQGMITFYETPVGQSVITKMPLIMQNRWELYKVDFHLLCKNHTFNL